MEMTGAKVQFGTATSTGREYKVFRARSETCESAAVLRKTSESAKMAALRHVWSHPGKRNERGVQVLTGRSHQ